MDIAAALDKGHLKGDLSNKHFYPNMLGNLLVMKKLEL